MASILRDYFKSGWQVLRQGSRHLLIVCPCPERHVRAISHGAKTSSHHLVAQARKDRRRCGA